MGLFGSKLSREELEIYEACTCLHGNEVLELYDKFVGLKGVVAKDADSEAVVRGKGGEARLSVAGADMEGGKLEVGAVEGKRVKMAKVIAQSEFRNNPFRERLCYCFTSIDESDADNYGDLTFDEFVDLYNVMHVRAPKDIKMQTAFRLYDFDGDGYLKQCDLEALLTCISSPRGKPSLLSSEEQKDIVERVMKDCECCTAATAATLAATCARVAFAQVPAIRSPFALASPTLVRRRYRRQRPAVVYGVHQGRKAHA